MSTPPEDPLHLVVFLHHNKLSGLYVVGDGITITSPIRTVEAGIFLLLAAYYVFNVDYPRQYAMVLAVLQTLVLEEPYTKTTSKKFAFLIKRLRKGMEETPDSSDYEDEDDEEEPPSKKRTSTQEQGSADNLSRAGSEDGNTVAMGKTDGTESADNDLQVTGASIKPPGPVDDRTGAGLGVSINVEQEPTENQRKRKRKIKKPAKFL